jgi:hypothetical protein
MPACIRPVALLAPFAIIADALSYFASALFVSMQ